MEETVEAKATQTRPIAVLVRIMMYKPFIYAGIVFGIAYAITHDYWFSGVNGFGVFYFAYIREQKLEQNRANMEVGL